MTTDARNSPNAPPGDSTDLLKQLQATHLVLIAACFALLIACTLAPSARIEQALDQAAAAIAVDRQLDNTWLKGKIDELTRHTIASSDGRLASYTELLGTHLLFSLNGNLVFGLEVPPSTTPEVSFVTGRNVTPSLESKSPRTLAQFQTEWNALWNTRAVVVRRQELDLAAFELPSHARKLGSWRTARGTGKERICYLKAPGVNITEDSDRYVLSLGEWDPRGCYSQAVGAFDSVTSLPLSRSQIEPIAVPFLSEMIRESGVGLRADLFRESLYDLAQVAEGLESIDLAELRNYVERLRTDNGQHVEIVGVQLPLEAISLWGSVIAVAIQVYLWLHLRRFRALDFHRVRDSWWLGLYPDIAARIVFQGSVSVLPIAAVLALGITALSHRSAVLPLTVVTLAALMATVVGIATVRMLRGMIKESVAA